ncbi:MAG: FkbM family methyltransferase [Pyrinomonadaceae bacterium]|nr:FkbM family methyltransferase [Pyrinomonadaceae bacterium]
MNENAKKWLRTFQTNFSFALDAKFAAMRFYRNKRGIPFETDFHALSLFPDLKEALFLDVGANRGQSTDAMLLKTKNSLIQQFEPNAMLCEKIARQFDGNNRVTLSKFGLGDETGERILFVPFYKQWMFDGLASFDESEARDWLKNHLVFYKDQNLSLREIRCKTKRLDELSLEPFFIKLDIQGYEYQALKGGEQTIKTHQPILLIETPNEKIINYLKGFDYQFYAFTGGKFVSGVMRGQNTFFMTKDKFSLVREHIEPLR